MAVTRIWRVRGRAGAVIDYAENPEKTMAEIAGDEIADADDVLDYADDEYKTAYHHYTTGINCDKENAKEEFGLTKNEFGKQGGIVAIHGYQSFEEEDLTPDEAHEIGVALARELWGDRFQVVVATHVNTKHVHNHFVINSVSFKDGRRFHMCTDRYMEMKEASDRLCREHALSVIEHTSGRSMSYYCWKMEKNGMPTRYSVARQALDEAISRSVNMEELQYELRALGYSSQFSPNRRYWTITTPGGAKPIRTYRLGEEYTRERILERIYENDETVRYRNFEDMYRKRPNNYHMTRRINKINTRTGLEKLYLRVCYELGYLPKYTQDPLKVNALFRDELLKCDHYAREARLLAGNKIETIEDLDGFVREKKTKMLELVGSREELRKAVRRKMPEDERTKIKERITELTSRLKDVRSDLALCEDIKERSGDMEEKIRTIDKEKGAREEVRA